MKTRKQFQHMYQQKSYKKVIDLIDGNEEIYTDEGNGDKRIVERVNSNAESDDEKTVNSVYNSEKRNQNINEEYSEEEIDSTGLTKRRKKDLELKMEKKKQKEKKRAESGLFEAEEVIDKKSRHGCIYYKVKWKGYPEEEATWEARANFTPETSHLIREYEKKKKKLNNKDANANGLSNDAMNDSNNPKKRLSLGLKRARSTNKESKHNNENSNLSPVTTNANSNLIPTESNEKKYSRRMLRRSHNQQGNKRISYIEEINLATSEESDLDSDEEKYEGGSSNKSPDSLSDIISQSNTEYNLNSGNVMKVASNSTNKIKNKQSKGKSSSNQNIIPSLNSQQDNNKTSQGQGNGESQMGDIKYDKVKRIVSATIINPKEVELSCLLEFEQRADGFVPDKRRYSSKIVRFYAPQALIDFYQSRICINKNI